MCRLVETKVLLCPKRISENDCMLLLVIIVGYLKRDWCVSLCCKRMFHMLWHSSYLQILPMDMNLYMEIVALYRVYTDLIATATILLRSWCQKGGKWVKNTGDQENKYPCGSISMHHMGLSFSKNKTYINFKSLWDFTLKLHFKTVVLLKCSWVYTLY